MIVCPNCNHPNPDGAVQCEACYTPLPATTNCPNCGATVQADASFCGQCGYNLRAAAPAAAIAPTAVAVTVAPDISEPPPLVVPDPLVPPQPVTVNGSANNNASNSSPFTPTAVSVPDPQFTEAQNSEPPTIAAPPPPVSPEPVAAPEPEPITAAAQPVAPPPVVAAPAPTVTPPPPEPVPAPIPTPAPPPPTPVAVPPASRTQLQQVTARLIHVQSDRDIELPLNLSVVHIGKPNDRIPPDIDVSGFPNSEIVSRIHADLRIEGDAYYMEDVGSSNGTYVNNLPLLPGNRHRLRPGDRISLGKGDLVTFLFQIS
ncbi:peptide-binding protein [Scytonema hofmannii PCC 7110]|uniref:Peptide-binding protein n=1 Tax=Scytonema hofmannii PCC 7110 TaxID=128403 RepID=A0A139XC53_9CYAN|nr:FHA domain-containing protein [Scytonema hofmannii]KYC42202.1 peptide-binding protein [Scytonema hofmannii PCC 7110]